MDNVQKMGGWGGYLHFRKPQNKWTVFRVPCLSLVASSTCELVNWPISARSEWQRVAMEWPHKDWLPMLKSQPSTKLLGWMLTA